jgi:hypothetical protein
MRAANPAPDWPPASSRIPRPGQTRRESGRFKAYKASSSDRCDWHPGAAYHFSSGTHIRYWPETALVVNGMVAAMR